MPSIAQLTSLTADVLKGRPAKMRSPKWPGVRAAHLKQQPVCQACGTTNNLNVHHKIPFVRVPSMELEPSNLITLCESSGRNCHYVFGHLSTSWLAWNEKVVEDAATHKARISEWMKRR